MVSFLFTKSALCSCAEVRHTGLHAWSNGVHGAASEGEAPPPPPPPPPTEKLPVHAAPEVEEDLELDVVLALPERDGGSDVRPGAHALCTLAGCLGFCCRLHYLGSTCLSARNKVMFANCAGRSYRTFSLGPLDIRLSPVWHMLSVKSFLAATWHACVLQPTCPGCKRRIPRL